MTDLPIDPATDHDYNARDSVPSFDAAYGALVDLSAHAQSSVPYTPDLVFDPERGLALDLYGAGGPRPVFLWIHGGYWRIGTKEENAFAAPGLVAQGIAVAVMDYSLAPAVTLYDIVHQTRLAVAWLHREGPKFGLDTHRIHLGGSSAGGHLVGAILSSGWHKDYGVPEHVVGAALALSGIFDLDPLRRTQVNGWMGLDETAVADLSPIRHIPTATDARLLLSVGGEERAGFLHETDAYGAAWRRAGHSLREIPMPGHDHFSIAGTLADPQGTLVQETADAIREFHAEWARP